MSLCCIAAATEDTLPDIAGVPSVRLLEAAGFRPQVSSENFPFTVKCPCCGESLGVDGDRVICQPRCKLHHGRLVDALAYKLGCGHRGLREHMEARSGWLSKRPKWRERISNYLKAASKLHWFNLAAKGFKPPVDNISTSRLLSWSEKNGVLSLLEDTTAVLLDGETVAELCKRATGISSHRTEKFALFHWIDDSTPVAVTLVGREEPPAQIKFQSFAVASTGLHLPATGRRILGQELAWHLQNTEYSERHDTWIGGSGVAGLRVPVAVIDRDFREDWLGWGRLVTGCSDLVIRKDGREVVPDDWLMHTMIRLTEKDQWPLQATAVVECLCVPGDAMNRILGELQARGRVRAARELRGRILTATVWSDDKYQLKRTAMGMILHDRLQGTDREICNFLVDANCNIVFPETSEIIHELLVDVGGSQFLVEINSGDLHAVSKFQDALRLGAASRGGDTLPMVSDHAACHKFVLKWLRQNAAVAKQVLGRSMLGWNPTKTAFQSVTWRLTEDSWTESEVRLKTSVPALACFDSKAVPSDSDIKVLPQPAKDMLAMIAGMTARYYVRSAVRAVCVQNSAAARGLLKAIFRGFGQVRELEMNEFRSQQALQGIQGHPLLATGFTQMQADKLTMPVVMLSETGYSVQDHDEALAPRITACSRYILQQVITWLMATEGKEFNECHAFRYSLGLMEEGAKVLKLACEVPTWETTIPEFPALQKMVKELRPEKAFERFTLINETQAKITCGKLVKANDLTMELLLLGISAKDEEGGLVVPAAPLITLLQDYWGVSPMLVT